jgi:hypothetical protein
VTNKQGTIGVAALFGVGASCGFGLFFLAAIGMRVSHTVDSFFTGVTIAAGTKPLHDFMSSSRGAVRWADQR